jgi:2-haloacid dehalogenase
MALGKSHETETTAYPEVKNVLAQLKARGFKCAILSNCSPNMLTSAIENAGIQSLLDAVLSVEDVQVYRTNYWPPESRFSHSH